VEAGAASALLVLNELPATAAHFRRIRALPRHLKQQRNIALNELVFRDSRARVPALKFKSLPALFLAIFSVPHMS
jgi:hypothetical protein